MKPRSATLLALVLIVAVGALLAPLKGVEPSPDSYLYLHGAQRIHAHPGAASLLVRRPLFPAMIAGSFALFGESIRSGFHVVRLFFVVNLVLAFLLGLSLAGRRAGLCAAALTLTSGMANDSSARMLLDNVILGFVLGFLLLYHRGLATGRARWFLAAGAALGASLLVKDVIAVPLLLLPPALLLSRAHRRRVRAGAPAFLAGLAAVAAPYAAGLLSRPGGLELLLGPFGRALAQRGTLEPAAAGVAQIAHLPRLVLPAHWLFHTYVTGQHAIWPLLAAGLAGTLWRAARRDPAAAFLAAALVVYLPLLVVVLRMGLRPGQLLTPFALLYLALALVLAGEGGAAAPARGGLLVVVFAVALQALYPVSGTPLFSHLLAGRRSGGAAGFSYWRGGFEVYGAYAPGMRAASHWIVRHSRPGVGVAAGPRYDDALAFYSGGRIRALELTGQRVVPAFERQVAARRLRPGRALYVVWRSGLPEVQNEGLLRDALNRGRVRWVVLRRRGDAMDPRYFDGHPQVLEAKRMVQSWVRIFRVVGPGLGPRRSARLRFGVGAYPHLRGLLARGEPRARLETWMTRVLGMSAAEARSALDLLLREQFQEFRKRFMIEGVPAGEPS